jgi:outer membrane receptor protein involved in Fe transport
MAVLLPLLSLARESVAAQISDPSSLASELEKVDDISEINLVDLLAAPIVESASRRKQSLDDAPASVTQLEADEVAISGAISLADLFRQVPGVFVFERRSNSFDVGLRGNYRVLLLVDGRVVATLDGTPFWEGLYFHAGEIDRIEVLRGPGSIVFGADGLSGVINVVTKHPLNQQAVEGSAATGFSVLPNQTNDTSGSRMREFGTGFVSMTWNNEARKLAAKLTLGAGQLPDWVDLPPPAVRPHGDFNFHGALTFDYRPNKNTSVFLDLRHGQNETIQTMITTFYESHVTNSATLNLQSLDVLKNTDVNVVADVQRQGYVDNAVGVDGMSMVPTKPMMITYHGMGQIDHRQFGDRNVFSIAGELAYKSVDGLMGSDAQTFKSAFVLQNETVFLQAPRLVLSLGVRIERVAVTMNQHPDIAYVHSSPRLSLSLGFSEKHTLRASATRAHRNPDILMTYMDVEYPGVYQAPTPPLVLIRSNPWLKPEEVVSGELGYRGHPWRWLRIDATVYVQELRNRIEFYRAAVPIFSENGPTEWQAGLELGIKVRPISWFSGFASYGYLYNTRDVPSAAYGFPSHVLSLGFDTTWRDYRFDANFHWFSRFVEGTYNLSDTSVSLDQYQSHVEPMLNLRVARKLADLGAEVFLSARNVLSLGRSVDQLSVAPSAQVNPIGATFILGLRLATQ